MTKNVLDTDLSGKVAVVTGAGGVLCSYLAKVLARAGAKVALVNRSDAAINKYAEEIIAEGGIAKAYKGNVLSREDMERIADQILEELGPCDILLNGAGGNNPSAQTDKEYYEAGDLDREEIKTFFDLDNDGVNAVFSLNYTGTLIPTQAFAKHMVRTGAGNIINISSMNAFLPLTKIPAYSGAKAAVSNFTQWLAVHFSKCNIRVNAIAPGFFASKQNQSLLFNEDGTPTKRTEKILAGTPMGRFGKTEDLAGGLLFLLNDEAAGFITGVVLPIDGGFSAYSGV
ncbi:MAG: SDR family oxidoreductase [Fusicatenibacter sp.]|nr:SDR family oxidoreductase [Fusicatenibacter sp.]